MLKQGVKNPWLLLIVSVLAAFTGGYTCRGDEPSSLRIDGPTKYGPNELVRLRAGGAPEKAALLWRVSPDGRVQRASTGKMQLQFIAPPGSYSVELLALSLVGGEVVADAVQITVELAGCGPELPPKPGIPGPGAAPPPPARSAGSKALGLIRFGPYACTATVIGPRRPDGRWDVLTASHCTEQTPTRGTLTLQDGRTVGVQVVNNNPTADLCWLVTDAADLGELPAAILAPKVPPVGTRIYHQGYGVHLPGNREDGTTSGGLNFDGQLPCDLSVSKGDSGGGIFDATTEELLAVVCCTSRLNARGLMYGGSSVKALAMRPAATFQRLPLLIE